MESLEAGGRVHLSIRLRQGIVIASGAGKLHKAVAFGPPRVLVHYYLQIHTMR